jgi:hypothetical protein
MRGRVLYEKYSTYLDALCGCADVLLAAAVGVVRVSFIGMIPTAIKSIEAMPHQNELQQILDNQKAVQEALVLLVQRQQCSPGEEEERTKKIGDLLARVSTNDE